MRQRAAPTKGPLRRNRQAHPYDLRHHSMLLEREDADRIEEWTSPRRPTSLHQMSLSENIIDYDESMLDITDVSSNFGESMESASVAGPLTSATSTTCSKISVDISMMYNPLAGNLAVRIVELRNLNAAARYSNCVQLRLLLLPERKQRQ